MKEPGQRDDTWIGRRVGEYRRDRNWTLAALAEKVGLSTTQLSRIESGTRQPSVGTLIEIAHAFGVSLSRLVDEQYTATYQLVRIADRVAVPSANGILTSLGGDFPALQPVHLSIPPAAEAPDAHHGGEEWLYVLSGAVDVRIGGDTVSVAEGDAIHFLSGTTHRVHNPGGAPAEVLIVSTSAAG